MKNITVNGRKFGMVAEDEKISYDLVLELAGETTGATVTYRYKLPAIKGIEHFEGAEKAGSMWPGKSIPLVEGTIFNAVHTGNA